MDDDRAIAVPLGEDGSQAVAEITDRRRPERPRAHPLGGAADITVVGLSTYAVYRIAQTCGFSGLGSYTQSWLHCDTRAELGRSPAWAWHNGIIR